MTHHGTRLAMVRSSVLCLAGFCATMGSYGQTAPSTPTTAAQPPAYTLNVGTRLVVEDISVTDKHGNPVRHLPQTAFGIQDNGAAQHIESFHEGREAELGPLLTPAPGAFTNATLYGSTRPVIAMLIDPVSMSLPDQMLLRLQVLQFLHHAPEDAQITLFRANSRGIPVLIQSLTTDHHLLEAAVDASVPAIPRTSSSLFSTGIAELGNISAYLRAVPGRKVLLWFAGQFPLYLDPALCSAIGPVTPTIDSSLTYGDCGSLNDTMKQSFRDLEQARIAVDPIDVRGVVVLGPPPRPATSTALMNSPGSIGARPEEASQSLDGEYDLEDQLARATGGHAFHSDNQLSAAMDEAVMLGEDAYTLAYRPTNYTPNGDWHRIRISVEGPYTVRYRQGYYAADAAPPTRPVLTATGAVKPAARATTAEASSAAESDQPLLFSAHVQPAPAASKSPRFLIDYSIPTQQLQFSAGPSGEAHARFRLAVLAYNTEGDVQAQAMDIIDTHFTPSQMALAGRIGTPAQQTIRIGHGSQFLLLAVEDLQTHRVGTVQVPLKDVPH